MEPTEQTENAWNTAQWPMGYTAFPLAPMEQSLVAVLSLLVSEMHSVKSKV